jgi:hypothetical protein
MFEYFESLRHFLIKIAWKTEKKLVDCSEEQFKAKTIEFKVGLY